MLEIVQMNKNYIIDDLIYRHWFKLIKRHLKYYLLNTKIKIIFLFTFFLLIK